MIIIGGVIIVFVSGYFGFQKTGEANSLWEILYRILQLFVLEFNVPAAAEVNLELHIARFLASFLSVYTAVSALILIFHERLQLIKLRFKRGHIVICGLGTIGMLLTRKFLSAGEKVAVIEIDEENDYIDECRNNGAAVLVGNAAAPYILLQAGIERASHLFSMCGQDNTNAEIAIQTRQLLAGRRKKPMTCVVHIKDPKLCRSIKEREFGAEKNAAFRLEFLNLYDRAAKILVKSYSPFPDKGSVPVLLPHILIIGAGNMGESLVVELVKNWHDRPDRGDRKIKISLIDRAAREKQALFYIRYPGLPVVCDIVPLDMEIGSPAFEAGQYLFDDNRQCGLTAVYICLDEDSLVISTALALNHVLRDNDLPIVICLNSRTGLAELIHDDAHGLKRLHTFALLDAVLDPEFLLLGTHEILARAIHDEYLREQRAKGDTPEKNPSLVPWDELPETLKDSSRRQADYLAVKLSKIGCSIIPMSDWNALTIQFSDEEIEIMAQMEHDDWLEERLQDGWVYTPKQKDNRRKKHPSIISWEDLPESEKEKDREPVREMPHILEKAGFQIVRQVHK